MRTVAVQLAEPWQIPPGEPEWVVAHLIYPAHLLTDREQALEDATRFIYARLKAIQTKFIADNYKLGNY